MNQLWQLPSTLRHTQNYVTDCEVDHVSTVKPIQRKSYVRQSRGRRDFKRNGKLSDKNAWFSFTIF